MDKFIAAAFEQSDLLKMAMDHIFLSRQHFCKFGLVIVEEIRVRYDNQRDSNAKSFQDRTRT